MARTGRPKSPNSKDTQLAVRLNQNELKKLDAVAEYYHETRVESLRRGIIEIHEKIMECTKDNK